MKYSEDKIIFNKIEELFAYRQLTELFKQSGLDANSAFVSGLYELQYQIYLFDAYLESVWDLDESKLQAYWTGIKDALKPFHLEDKKIHKLLKEIRSYARIESNCRKGKWPDEISYKQFYTTKSCDVRLMRHLLYKSYPELNYFCLEKSWIYYDLITEINDDIADIYEDLETYNANRFLISILRHGHLQTCESYAQFIAKVAFRATEYFKIYHSLGENAQVFEWTTNRTLETMELLQSTTDTLNHELCTSSWWLEKMK